MGEDRDHPGKLICLDCLEMLLPELELNLARRHVVACLPDVPRRLAGTAEVHTDTRLDARLQTGHVSPVQDAVTHAREQLLEVGATEVGPAAQLGERVLVCADGVEDDVLRSGRVQALGEVGVDAQEVVAVAATLLQGLRLEGGEQCLEPLE